MRICYLCSDPGIALVKRNGSAAHLGSIVRSFVALGHEVELLMTEPEGAHELGVPVHPLPTSQLAGSLQQLSRDMQASREDSRRSRSVLRALRHIWNNSHVERAASEILSQRRPDMVYERYSPFSVAGAMIARQLGVPHLLEVNAPLAWEGAVHRGQALNAAAEVLERLTFEATSTIVAVSDELREQLVASGVDATKIRVVPNGVDTHRFSTDGARLPVGLEDRLVVGFVGSLKPWHGIDLLTETFARLSDDPRLHLLVVGDGPLASLVEDLRARFPDQVTLTGPVTPDEVPAYLRTMDIAVAPYPPLERFYFSPLKVLEYMSTGKAVIASRIGQLEWLIRDGETGLLVEPGDRQAFEASLRRMIDDASLRARLGHQAAVEARRHHGWMQRASEILELVPIAA